MKDRTRPGPTGSPRRAARVGVGVAAAAAAIVLVAACGESGDGGVAAPSVSATGSIGLPTSLPSGLPTSLPTGLPTGLLPSISGTNIPKDFPIPPGAKAEVRSVGGKDALSLTGVSADDALAFYRRALPGAGYKIVSDVGGGALPGGLGFTGHGVSGAVAGADSLGQSVVLVSFVKAG
jgi:hypothetical protein